METILIDENVLVEKFVDKVKEKNKILINSKKQKMVENGINPNCYVGGLEIAYSYKSMSLEENINNLISTYSSNYAESLFFQCENIKYVEMFNLISCYLRVKGLEDDFLSFRNGLQTQAIPQVVSTNVNGEIE